MLMLLRALHAIAAQRGDGLRPELVQMISQSPPCTSIDRAAEVPKKGDEFSSASEDVPSPSSAVIVLVDRSS